MGYPVGAARKVEQLERQRGICFREPTTFRIFLPLNSDEKMVVFSFRSSAGSDGESTGGRIENAIC